MVKYAEASMDAVFAALADPTRRAILQRLATVGEQTVSDLAAPFDVSLPAVSRHIRVLVHAGLLVQQKDGRIRRCELDARPLQQASDWIKQYESFWETQLDSLAAYIDALETGGENGLTNSKA